MYQQFGDTVNVVVPMGYRRRELLERFDQAGLALFSAENQILSEKNGI